MRGINWWLVAGATLLVVDVGAWALIGRANAVFIPWGQDYREYIAAASAWLHGGAFYHPYQLAGSYEIWQSSPEPILYPPVVLWLLSPFTVLPAVAWWVIPLGLTIWRVARAPRERWLLCLALALWPQTIAGFGVGNPGMYVWAALALAPTFAPLGLFKPTIPPWILIGVNKRSWWLGFAAFGLMCLPFGAMWSDWLTAVHNSGGSPLYIVTVIPPVPFVAMVSFGGAPAGSVTGPWSRRRSGPALAWRSPGR